MWISVECGLSRVADTTRPHHPKEVRHKETNCTRTHRNGRSKPESRSRGPEQAGAERSGRESQHRSLDHGIGVRIPASQPIPAYNNDLRAASVRRESLTLRPLSR